MRLKKDIIIDSATNIKLENRREFMIYNRIAKTMLKTDMISIKI